MDVVFEKREAKVLIVEPLSSVRQLLNEAVRNNGFKDFIFVESSKEALYLLETEPIDWLFISLFANNPINTMQLLKIFSQMELPLPKVTLILEESEAACLPMAFEMGLFSWMSKPLTRETIQKEVTELIQTYERSGWNSRVTSAKYLHKYLLQQNKAQLVYTFEKVILEKYPANPVLLHMLSETQFALGYTEVACHTLNLLKMSDARFEKDIRETLAKNGNPKIDLSNVTLNLSVFGISSCLIVEPDDTIRQQIADIIKQANVPTIHAVADGETAFVWLKEKNIPNLIIQEWNIPKLAGPILLQRLRAEGLSTAPIVVLSSYVQPQDHQLLREMGVTVVLGKPFEPKAFMEGLLNALLQNSLAADYTVLERRIRQALLGAQRTEADELRSKLDSTKGVTLGMRRYIDAEFAFADKDYNAAREAAIDAARFGNETVSVLNLLGKSLMKLGDYEFALRCFTNAQNLSPQNIERLCNIAETNLELSAHQEREAALDQAKSMDADSKVVKETQAKIGIAVGDVGMAEEALADLESLTNFFSFMNNKAVAMSRSGKFEDAAELYSNVINALAAKKPEEWYLIQYNLALSQIKMQNLAEAKATLDKVVANKQSRVFEKAHTLLTRLSQAIKAGEKTLQLHTASSGSSEEAGVQHSKNEKLKAILEKKEFVQCCFGLFSNPDPVPGQIKSLIATLPAFNFREALRLNRLGFESPKVENHDS